MTPYLIQSKEKFKDIEMNIDRDRLEKLIQKFSSDYVGSLYQAELIDYAKEKVVQDVKQKMKRKKSIMIEEMCDFWGIGSLDEIYEGD